MCVCVCVFCRVCEILTLRRCPRAGGGNLSHPATMATEGDQPGHDGRLAEAHVAHNDRPAALSGLALDPQPILQLLEQPITAHEHRVHGNAGHLEEEGLQHDLSRLVRSEAGWRETEREREREQIL